MTSGYPNVARCLSRTEITVLAHTDWMISSIWNLEWAYSSTSTMSMSSSRVHCSETRSNCCLHYIIHLWKLTCWPQSFLGLENNAHSGTGWWHVYHVIFGGLFDVFYLHSPLHVFYSAGWCDEFDILLIQLLVPLCMIWLSCFLTMVIAQTASPRNRVSYWNITENCTMLILLAKALLKQVPT